MPPEATPPTSFAELLAQVARQVPSPNPSALDEPARVFGVELPGDWGQGRSSFGGALAGLGLTAMSAIVPLPGPGEPPRRCRSLQVDFVGPVAAGPVELRARLLRHGRSATQVMVELGDVTGEAGVGCVMTASFASPRASAIAVAGVPRPELAGPAGLISLPYIPGVVPAFTRHFELRWAEGGPPGSGLAQTGARGWARFRERAVGVGAAWIAALVDAWPAPILQTLRRPAIASSVTWTLDFLDVEADAASDDWWAFAVETEAAADGWAYTRARLWSPAGRLAALSSQAVAIFA